MLILNNIKIRYSQEGYLPNYPPHLISDYEMAQAFIKSDPSYFYDEYPLLSSTLSYEYDVLVNALKFHLSRFLSAVPEWQTNLPNWVYSYMLGVVIRNDSLVQDRHYFLCGLDVDNIDDIITAESQVACYKLSEKYVNKLDKNVRFVDMSRFYEEYSKDAFNTVLEELNQWGLDCSKSSIIPARPATMFGEPHIIKLIRLQEAQ